MKEPHVLRWPDCGDHTLVLQEDTYRLHVVLKLRKKCGCQNLYLRLPDHVTTQKFLDAWEKQPGHWKELHVRDGRAEGKPFEAVRIIDLTKECGIRIVWYVCHFNDVPADLLVVWTEPVSEQELVRVFMPEATFEGLPLATAV
ncbi:MAG: hypothetical protein PHW10_03470 [Candidatus Peribacteraceae bacterium]|nr:hypothetical protein [Candidatus Peribacteraceae bacterium]